jgi:hypothetical protein
LHRLALLPIAAVSLAAALLTAHPSYAQTWLDNQWTYRRAVDIANPGGTALTDFQVHVSVSGAFDFAKARSDGGDLRVTAADGVTPLPLWIERWNPGASQGDLWTRLPALPAGGTTVYLYYGNAAATSSSSGDSTFDFFDDFDHSPTATGYYALSDSQTILVRDQAWETEAPHTLSVVRAPGGAASAYYGYYGLEVCGGIGMAGSDDLLHWTKLPSNPLFIGGGERWPSVILADGTYYMMHTVDYCTTSNIVLRTSANGRQWSAPASVVPPVGGQHNQNPSLFRDPVSGHFYLHWYRGNDSNFWSIMARTASTVQDLATAPDVQLLSSSSALAAPNLIYRDGTYFMSTEVLHDGWINGVYTGEWMTRIYTGSSPTGPFTALPGNPTLMGGTACLFQTPIDSTLYCYSCQYANDHWTVAVRTADLRLPRREVATVNTSKWTVDNLDWSGPAAVQQDGAVGGVAQGITYGVQVLASKFTGTDFVLEGYGRLAVGRVWGLGVRTTDSRNTYSLNLYEDLDGTDNLYLYRWVDGGATTVWSTSVGPIDPNVWYKLTVKMHASFFDIYLNDVLKSVVTVSDPHFTSGAVGLYGERGTTAYFNDVWVRRYAAVEPVATLGAEQTDATIGSIVASTPDSSCLRAGGCVAIPVRITRTNATPMRSYYARVRLSSNLALCGAGFVADTLLSSIGPSSFTVVDAGAGTFDVRDSLQGAECGATAGGTLFTVYVGTASLGGTESVVVDSAAVRGCGEQPLPAGTGPATPVPVTGAVTQLTAAQIGSGGTNGRTGIRITFAPPAHASRVEVYRKGFGNYPAYDGEPTPGAEPAVPTGYPPGGWTLTGVQASGDVDLPPVRDHWYFVAYSIDSCGSAMAPSMTGGTLNYVLGDVHDGAAACAGDNQVTDADVGFMAAHYGAAIGSADTLACLDVGPTTTEWADGRPLTDRRVDFEDLAFFAMDYGVTEQTARPGPGSPGGGVLTLQVGEVPGVNGTFDAVLNFNGIGHVQLLSATLDYDSLVVTPVGVAPGWLLAQQAGPGRVFSPSAGVIDAAVFGRGKTLAGAGELARVTFLVKAAGSPNIALESLKARDPSNRPVPLLDETVLQAQPLSTRLALAPTYPNPFTGATTVAFGLPAAGAARLRVFDVQGRVVRRLLEGVAGAGWTRVTWDGRGDDGRALPTGAYVVRLAARGRVISKSVLLLR